MGLREVAADHLGRKAGTEDEIHTAELATGMDSVAKCAVEKEAAYM